MAKKGRIKEENVVRTLLRTGSRDAKKQLLSQSSHCDICGMEGDADTLQLHHIYCIRWGFTTNVKRCRLLCPNCHYKLHHKYDHYLDDLYWQNPATDFISIYEEIKKEMQDNQLNKAIY